MLKSVDDDMDSFRCRACDFDQIVETADGTRQCSNCAWPIEGTPRWCLACGSDDRDEFVDGSVACSECSWPVYTDPVEYAATGSTPDGRMLPSMREMWAPCQRCGLTHDAPPFEGTVTCTECGHVLVRWGLRDLAGPEVVGSLRERWLALAGRPESADLVVGDRVVVGNGRLVGADPFTPLFVLSVTDFDTVDLVREEDGTTWYTVPVEYLNGRV